MYLALLAVLAREVSLEVFTLLNLTLQLAEFVELQMDLRHKEVCELFAEQVLDTGIFCARLHSFALASCVTF